MSKLPSFQFYPADWLNDIKLQSCSLESQGLLINLMCLMHQAIPYGHLIINGSMPADKEVARLLRLHHKTYHTRLKELLLYGALRQSENGVIFCKRMVEDEQLRTIRREAGKMGGSPLLKQKVNQVAKQKPTPSSSSSISSSSSKKKDKKSIEYPLWLDLDLWDEFKKYRTKIRSPLTELAEKLCLTDLTKLVDAGENQIECINETIKSGKWKSFYPVKNKSHAILEPKQSRTMTDEEIKREIDRDE